MKRRSATTSIAQRVSMRYAIVAGALMLAISGCGGSDEESDTQERPASGTLFVQSADRGTIEERGGSLTMTLHGVSPSTTTFTDRPERKSGVMPTASFARSFDSLFDDVLPNADLSSLEHAKGEFTLELSKPRYDRGKESISYPVSPIGTKAEVLPERFGPGSLFIDSGSPWTTSMRVFVSSPKRDFCQTNGLFGQAVLFNPKVIEAPDQWSVEPPSQFYVKDSIAEAFSAASKHGSTHFEVSYDITCGEAQAAGESLPPRAGTITLKGSVPQSAFNDDNFSCHYSDASTGSCVSDQEGGYHVGAYAYIYGSEGGPSKH